MPTPQGAKASLFVVGNDLAGSSTNALSYMSVFGTARTGTEANTQVQFDFPVVLKRVRFNVYANTKSNASSLAFRIGGVSYGTQNVNAGVTGQLDSGDISQIISVGTKSNWLIDTSASTTGSISVMYLAELQF